MVRRMKRPQTLQAILHLVPSLRFVVHAVHEAAAKEDANFLRAMRATKGLIHPETQRSLLHSACIGEGADNVVEYLLSSSLFERDDIVREDAFGNTAFHDACRNCTARTVSLLMRAWGDDDSLLCCRTRTGNTPLIAVCRVLDWQENAWRNTLKRRAEVVRVLIARGANFDYDTNKFGNTAAHYAVFPAHQALIGDLIVAKMFEDSKPFWDHSIGLLSRRF